MFSVSLPLNVAASISSNITKLLLLDSSLRSYEIIYDFQNIENLEKLVSILTSQSFSKKMVLNKKDAMDFANFGAFIGNEEFIKPFRAIISEGESPIDSKNVVERLKEKEIISMIDETDLSDSLELSFIKKHFNEVCENPEFIKWCLCERNSDKVEEIVRSDELLLSSEDELLTFIIKLNSDFKFTHLFKYVHLEFCSNEICKDFLDYINNDAFFQSSVSRNSILSCLSSSLLHNSFSRHSFNSVEPRYTPTFFNEIVGKSSWRQGEELAKLKGEKIEVKDNPLNGILRREHRNDNVLMEASSTYDGGVYNLIDDDEKNDFWSDNEENSFFIASLNDKKSFVINNYSLKRQNNCLHPKNWVIEGQRSSDGKWISLDNQNNVKLDDDKVHTFKVSCNEILKAVKFTMKGGNSSKRKRKSYNLVLSSFDIFGTIINPQ